MRDENRLMMLAPAINMLQQQDKFEDFIREYNCERPHEALEMKTPSALYEPSSVLMEVCRRLNIPSMTASSLSLREVAPLV